jgi:hypothetical protein
MSAEYTANLNTAERLGRLEERMDNIEEQSAKQATRLEWIMYLMIANLVAVVVNLFSELAKVRVP